MNAATKIAKKYNIYFALIYRSNSDRVPNKNKRKFYNNESLLSIKNSQLKDYIVISCGDDFNEHSNVKIDRKIDNLIDNNVPFSEVLSDIYNKINCDVRHLLITYPTCPFFNEIMYEKAIIEYYKNIICGDYDSIISGEFKKGFFWYDGKPINYNANSNHEYTQDLKPVFEVNNALYGGKFEVLKEKKYLIGDYPYFFDCSRNKLSNIDIDTMQDFVLAKSLYKQKIEGGFDDIF